MATSTFSKFYKARVVKTIVGNECLLYALGFTSSGKSHTGDVTSTHLKAAPSSTSRRHYNNSCSLLLIALVAIVSRFLESDQLLPIVTLVSSAVMSLFAVLQSIINLKRLEDRKKENEEDEDGFNT